jgi:alkylation response protein AidB-like acyl-CoA dehydrogenase
MDFDDTLDEATFRAEARGWLASVAEAKRGAFETWQSRYPGRAGYEGFERAKEFQAKKADAGFAALHWPAEWGGRALSPIYQVIYAQEESRYLVPRGYFEIGLGMCMPTLFTYATEEQKRRYAPRALRGDEVWCQLFSEPSAGSDLAGLRTRAVRDGDHWVVNGQKIWTSGAHWADWAILVARSDPKTAKHKGLTFFFLSMKSPGIETRRIKQISGGSHFNEVYFTDVRIPDTQRLGPVGGGWGVAITTLMNERLTSGDLRGPDFEEIFELARRVPLEDGPAIADAAIRERLADIYVKTQGVRLTRFRTMTALSRGDTPGPENSIGKLVNAPKAQEIASLAMDLLDMGGVVMDKDFAPMRAAFQESLLTSPGGRIAAGTDEILRNIIAERVLGLPQDIRVDRDVPFDQLPAGSRR